MTTRHLKIFQQVYLTGSMTAAAKDLYMTQPSVSQAIRELEEHYNTRLFERLYRRLYPTTAGERLYHYAGMVLDMFEEMETSLQSDSQPQTLNLGLFFTAGMLAQPWLEAFRKKYPTTDVHVQVWKGSELKRLLRNAQLDLAVMEESPGDDDLVQEIFAEDRLVAVSAPDAPLVKCDSVDTKTLASQPLLLREKGAGVRDQFEAQMHALGHTLHPHWESASTLVLLDAAKNREGIAILPYELAKSALERGEVAELKVTGIDLRRRMGLTWHRDKYITKAMADFMGIILSGNLPTASDDKH